MDITKTSSYPPLGTHTPGGGNNQREAHLAAVQIHTDWWWRLAGAPLLLLISLYGLYSHLSERAHRNNVLAHGTHAQALVIRASGAESVVVRWADASGQERTGESWVGKPFARQSVGKMVEIQYLPGSTREAVILSEAAERERVNSWWVSSNLAAAGAMTVICICIGVFLVVGKRRLD